MYINMCIYIYIYIYNIYIYIYIIQIQRVERAPAKPLAEAPRSRAAQGRWPSADG